MQTVTIREAKARLNALVKAAERGEQVVLMRGSRLVAAIVPVTDLQAERLWKRIEAERESGASLAFDAPEKAVASFASPRRRATPGKPAPRGQAVPRGDRGARRAR